MLAPYLRLAATLSARAFLADPLAAAVLPPLDLGEALGEAFGLFLGLFFGDLAFLGVAAGAAGAAAASAAGAAAGAAAAFLAALGFFGDLGFLAAFSFLGLAAALGFLAALGLADPSFLVFLAPVEAFLVFFSSGSTRSSKLERGLDLLELSRGNEASKSLAEMRDHLLNAKVLLKVLGNSSVAGTTTLLEGGDGLDSHITELQHTEKREMRSHMREM